VVERLRSFLDVGGGSGGASIGACQACPGLRATVAELPSIVSITEACVAEAGLGARIGVQAVDVTEARPEGIYDAALLRNLIQVLSADDARRVLRNTAAALRPEGEIYLIGHVLDDDRVAPPEVAAFNLVFINIYDDGQAYTESEYRGWLEDAGFVGFERQPLPRGRSLIAARKKT
jgi:cyclopropane fatty-acyl-phospholipid synthase-like methyltransferase